MKKKLILLLVLVLLFIGFIVIRFFILNKENNVGELKIVSSPAAGVFINNAAVGKTPFESKMPPGEVLIKLIPEGEGTQIVSWQGKVTIHRDALTYVSRELSSSEISSAGEILTITKMEKAGKSGHGQIVVETEPSGAIVYLDNIEQGISPLLLDNVPEDDHELSVFMPGFFRRTQKVNVESGYKVNATFKLALDQAAQTLEQTLEAKRQEASQAAKLAASQNKKTMIVIAETPTGFLRVREDSNTAAAEVARVNPGDTFELLEEKDGWYKIKLTDKEGWISAEFATKEESE